MNTKTFKTKEIIAYLLGNLPEVKTEVFDQLSFTDEDFSAELSAAEKDLVDAFVNGELKGETLEKFEAHYLASPLRREKVEFAKTFQTFAEKELSETSVLTKGLTKENKAGFFSGFFLIPKLPWQWGFALGTLVFFFLGGWMFLENFRLRTKMSQTQVRFEEIRKRESELTKQEKQLQDKIANQQVKNSETEKELVKVREERAKLEDELRKKQSLNQEKPRDQIAGTRKPPPPQSPQSRQISVASFILTPSLRGTDQLQKIAIPIGINSVDMRLEIESDDFSKYRVTLKNPSNGQTLWRSRNIGSKTSGSNKFLNVRFPEKLLKPQIYTLEVYGISTTNTAENISSYSFRVVR